MGWSVLEITEGLWPRLAPLLPTEPPRPKGGRPPVPHRKVLVGIVFMLLTGCAWRHLPAKALPLRQPGHLLAAGARLAGRRRLGAAAP